ncbi:hypothetical protein OF83DRAFT_742557 [Amylostereum chailletii]|nr:hypothetical protein OF83DRAFT_742557 [Amylostereum chailletii]
MFADAPHRIPMLRKLELYSDDNSKLNREHAQLLTELLTQASNIAELHLPDFDEGISQFPELLHAIEALPFVKIFDVETDKFACIPAAEKMSSSLTKVRFRADDKYTGRMLPTLGLLRPLSSLYTHASTLQELDFMTVQITDATIVFPHVHTLRLHRSHNSDLKVLVATFPNLRNLDIFNDPIINRCIMWTITAEDYRQQFRKNRETPSWPRLESLSGSPLTLCILCVSCPIGRLTVYGPSRNEDNCSQTNNVIAGLVPVDTVVLRLDAIVDSATEESIHLAIPVSRCFERLVINISMFSSNNELAPEGTIVSRPTNSYCRVPCA